MLAGFDSQTEAEGMGEQGAPALDFAREFPHLTAAPIAEAVIHWRARAEREWSQDQIQAELVQRLPDYPNQKPLSELGLLMEANLAEEGEPPSARRWGGWEGFRHTTADELNVAQFKRNGFVFSRLRPYQDWEAFEREARRLWNVFLELAKPSQVSRLGVRFINRIPIAANKELGDYLVEPPTRPLGLPLKKFLYQSTFSLPEHSLGVNVVKTIQGPQGSAAVENALILDSDVFTTRRLICDEPALNEVLPKMRWLKNAVFFSLLKPQAIAAFQGE